MIKYAINEDKKQIIAYLDNTRYDAERIIKKELVKCGLPITISFDGCSMSYNFTKLKMHDRYSGTVTLRDGDTWDVEKGKALAKQKCLDNYYRGLDKRLNKFYYDMSIALSKLCTLPDEQED